MRVAVLAVVVLGFVCVVEGAPVITVDVSRDIATVPRTLFGTNMRPEMEASERTAALLKDIGITVFRYPDSIDRGYRWNWDTDRMVLRGKGFPSWVKPEAALADFKNYVAFARTVGVQTVAVVNVRTLTGPDFLAHNDYYKEGDWRSWRTTEGVPPQTCTLTEGQVTLAVTPSADGVTTTYKVPAHSVLQLVFERAG